METFSIHGKNWSLPRAQLHKYSRSKFQTVEPAEVKAREPDVLWQTQGSQSQEMATSETGTQ